MADPCPLCGANRDVVGRVHRCVANRDVANKPTMANAMANRETVGTYRYRDAGKRRAYMRAYMRKRRSRSSSMSL